MFIDESFFGFARSGILDQKFQYPLILDITREDHIHVSNGSVKILGQVARPAAGPVSGQIGGIRENVEWISEDLLVIPDGAQLIQRPRRLMEKLSEVRERYGMSRLIYMQGVADPYLIPILVYAGVSIFDDSTLRMEPAGDFAFTIFGRARSEASATERNMEFVREVVASLSQPIKSGTLREVVEKYQISSKAMEIMRLLDNDEGGEAERFFPRRTPYIKANSLESLRRPDLVRYRNYISSSYRKPDGREVAVLMPCSARKPYSTSKSHKRIIEALGGTRGRLHELIVTSPVGIVPRELEQTYPASSYDIPVIGEWYEDEKAMINRTIEAYFRNNSYEHVVAFVDTDLEFIMNHLPSNSTLVKWDRGDASLSNLRETVSSLLSEIPPHGKVNHKMEKYAKIAEYQFGSWISKYMEGSRIVRNYNSDMLVKDGKPVLVFNERMGKFTINKQSGQWFIDNGKFMVEIDDFKPTANIYAVGVMGASEDVRQEDEVVLHHKGQLRGVGIAKMPVRAMQDLKKGVAVKVRN